MKGTSGTSTLDVVQRSTPAPTVSPSVSTTELATAPETDATARQATVEPTARFATTAPETRATTASACLMTSLPATRATASQRGEAPSVTCSDVLMLYARMEDPAGESDLPTYMQLQYRK